MTRVNLSLVVLASSALLVASCGGGSSTPGVATLSTSTTTASSLAGTSTQGTGLLAYASCMRSHGVPNFPDPNSGGGIDDKRAVIRALRGVSNSQAQATQDECQRLIPAGAGLGGKTSQPVAAQQQHYYLSAAACMRSHGITKFPDPAFSAGRVEFPGIDKIDTNSPQFIQARQTCQNLIPAGLPYSSGSEGQPGG
ncbi:MAG: hypothetical protein WBQ21_13185 [Solirubrobacteraceae bacterium]